MVTEIQNLINRVKTLTNVSVAVFTPSGELLYKTFDDEDIVPFLYEQADSFSDDKIGYTYFHVKKGHTSFVCAILGVDEAAKNYAALIKEIIEGSGAKTQLSRADKLRLYLTGELDEAQASALKAEYIGSPFNYYVLTLVTDSHAKLLELKSFLEAISDVGDIVVPYEEKAVAFIRKCSTEDEYQSANDFAYTLYDNIKEEMRINIVVNVGGTAHSFDDLVLFFRQCIFAYSFGKLMSPTSHIYSYKEYIMMKMLSDIPKSTLTQYLGTLLDKSCLDIISDDELMQTAEEFLKNSLNISETSRSMYMHRNTLIYRLDKLENATGLNIRHFNDAVIFRLITILNKLTIK